MLRARAGGKPCAVSWTRILQRSRLMYSEFFGLSIPPFNNTPDPRFFFNTPDHEEALASLIYCATDRKGFVLVTGEVGSGKTLLSRLLLTKLPAGTRTAVI